MKRLLIVAMLILIVPASGIAASATLGLYFCPHMYYFPAGPYEVFEAHLYIVQNEYSVTGIQYALETPSDPTHSLLVLLGIEYPFNHTVDIGDPWTGHAVTYNPPMDCYPYGYDLMMTYTFMTTVECEQMWDYQIYVVGHPDAGLEHPVYGGLYGTYAPYHEAFDIGGLMSVICPTEVDAKEESWGAIKSMYR
jgi:hypothetical protein